ASRRGLKGGAMLPERDEVEHLAALDALELASDFAALPARDRDERAYWAWVGVAQAMGLDGERRKRLHGVYLAALCAECARIVDRRDPPPTSRADEQPPSSA